jgi:hypothetical protein
MYIGCSTKNNHSETTISLFFQRDNHFHALAMMMADRPCTHGRRTRQWPFAEAVHTCKEGANESTLLVLKKLG